MEYITDGDGREYRVVEGAIEQGATYLMQWQDLEAEIDAAEVACGDRHTALDDVLKAAGRPPVFVERIPNDNDSAPSDGVHRVYAWNCTLDGAPAPGVLVRALERPSAAFFDKRERMAQSDLDRATAIADEAASVVKELAAIAESATEFKSYRALMEDGTLQRLADARAAHHAAVDHAEIAAASIAAARTDRTALKELGGKARPLSAIAAKAAEIGMAEAPATPVRIAPRVEV